jgi:hypothetical protein
MVIDIPDDWLPTVDNINALPEPLRRYIHDLETMADPAGIVLENYELRKMVSAADATFAKLKGEAGTQKGRRPPRG